MITGRQIREARSLLRWGMAALGNRAKVPVEIVARAESVDSTPSITLAQAAKIQAVCQAAGVRFDRTGRHAVLLSSVS